MSTGRVPSTLQSVYRSSIDKPAPNISLKRKLGLHGPLLGLGIAELCYPSPPVSMPPSPPPTQADSHRTPTPGESAVAPQPTPASTLSSISATASTSPLIGQHEQSATISSAHPLSVSSASSASVPLVSSNRPNQAPPAFAAYSTFPARPSRRTGRKANIHVASACVNCKRAHLSCDVQRPCTRCVALGKQDTCYDVQHKKRGRPRLRDETSFQVSEQPLQTQTPQPISPSTTVASSSSRPIATPRPRRASSLRSQASEGYQSQSYGVPSTSISQQLPTYQQPSTASLAPADVPTAFLSLDFVILRANRPFEQIMANDRVLTGRSLSEIARPADNSSLESIRTRLQAERDARERSSLPPIYPSSLNSLENVSEADVDHLAAGFEDHTYTWTRSSSSSGSHSSGQSVETFPVRVRLARSSTYFVAITLPTFRPVIAAPPPQQQPYPSFQPSYPPMQQSQSQAHSHSQTYNLREQARRSTSQPPPPSLPSPYATAPWLSSQHHHQQPPPRLPQLEPAPDMTPFRRRTSQADMLPPADRGGMQLAPIGGSSRSSGGPGGPSSVSVSASGGLQATQQISGTLRASRPSRSSASDDEDERAPKKRRIMGIDNVLQ